MNITHIQEEIVQEFGLFEEWMDKYNYLIDLGKDLAPMDASHKTEEHLINGCQSRVWLHAELHDGKIIFTADSDAIITKGLIAMLIQVMSDRTPDELVQADIYFIDKIGLKEHLSPTRSNGLLAMLKQMKLYALAYQTKLKG